MIAHPKPTKETFTELAAKHWGAAAPDWIMALAAEADRHTATKAASRIGYSTGAVSSVIRNTYKGNLEAVAENVKGALLGHSVECPVLGEIRKDQCNAEQKKSFTGTSAIRTRLYNACRGGCMHSRTGSAKEGGHDVID